MVKVFHNPEEYKRMTPIKELSINGNVFPVPNVRVNYNHVYDNDRLKGMILEISVNYANPNAHKIEELIKSVFKYNYLDEQINGVLCESLWDELDTMVTEAEHFDIYDSWRDYCLRGKA